MQPNESRHFQLNLGHAPYTMQSLPTSLERLHSLYVEVRASVQDIKVPDQTWWSREFTQFLIEHFSVQGGRAWSQTERGQVGLLPGQKATGFLYTSAGLPGIVKCMVRAHQKGHSAGEEAPDVLVDAIHKYNWMVPQGVTVGAESRPEPFVAGAFLGKIENYLSVSLEQGWIESRIVGKEFTDLINEIRTSVAKGDRPGALKLISSVLQRVENEKDKTLLSEAYALLRYNLEYLRTQVDQGSSSVKR